MFSVEIVVDGKVHEVEFLYSPAEGDGWNEPYYPESFEIVSEHPELDDETIINILKDMRCE